jgi:hypothetical protein
MISDKALEWSFRAVLVFCSICVVVAIVCQIMVYRNRFEHQRACREYMGNLEQCLQHEDLNGARYWLQKVKEEKP